MTPPLPSPYGSRIERRSAQGDPRVERPRTLSFARAAREYGLQPEDVRALVAAGIVWTVTPPGRSRPRVVRDGLDAWVDRGRPSADPPGRRAVYLMPKALSPRGGRRG
jgi:hypothetical protein